MVTGFDRDPQYIAERDGDLREYLASRDFGYGSTFPLFRGYEFFRRLWDEGYIIPDMSVIRVMWSFGREDEHYMVKGKSELTGITLPHHSGIPGTHNPRRILKNRLWEAQCLEPDPEPRRRKSVRNP
ncbi:MAG: hypothetical protein HYW25_03230 [Candidatus Aenigmarchaeota archaeon]|nr:hypothetical protein [Candidatus Aenigmarchaeota archaeon]